MAEFPDHFLEEYSDRGTGFNEVATVLLDNHGRQLTAEDIADEVSVEIRRVRQLLESLEEDGWINSREVPMTFVWNTEKHNPAEIHATEAVTELYRDLWRVFRKHSTTTTGTTAIIGFFLFVAASVLGFFFLTLATGLFGESIYPPSVFLVLGIALFFLGVLMTAAVSIQAVINRIRNKVVRVFKDD